MCTGIFLGTGKQKIPAVANFIGYYCIGLSLSITLMFVAKLRVLGNCMKWSCFVTVWDIINDTLEEQVIISEACCALDRLIYLLLCRFLAGTAHLCRRTIHLLHHCHLQAELEENDRGGELLANLTFRITHGTSCSHTLTEPGCLKRWDKSGTFQKLFVLCTNVEKVAVTFFVCLQAVKRAQKKTHMALLSTAADWTVSNGNVSGLLLS